MNSLYNKVMQRKNLKFLIPIFLIALVFAGFKNHFEAEAARRDRVVMELVYNVISKSHFMPREVNDDFSSDVFDNFIESLDYNKRFLLASDLKQLENYRYKLDDHLRAGNPEFFNKAFNIFKKRIEEAQGFYPVLLEGPFSFNSPDFVETDPEKLDFAKDGKALKARWRDYLHLRVMNRVYDRMTDYDKEDREDPNFTEKSIEDFEKEAREKELETHKDYFKNMEDLDRNDWMGMYMNAFTNAFDPHTEYFPPQRQEDFEIEMSGQLEGIGAQLSQRGDFITVEKIVSGSASWRQGELEEGDKILAVAQEGEEPVDVVGMSIRKAVKLIRGKKGTKVRLIVRKKDNTRREITIVRDIVELEATFARSAVLGDEEKIGYIRLPKFYVDFYKQSNRNCADDIKIEIEKLKAAGVQGIVLDLRNNGGGSLQAVVDIVGHFVDRGPVVQVKSTGQPTKVMAAKSQKPIWEGPLVVMVNQFSASASEIFAAAIQDYQRGVIIGSKSTFGKGTVQNVFDMDRMVTWSYNDLKPLGAIKVTIQKYYRINGGTPQLKGVTPDIVLPDNYNYIPFGEREQKHALPYNEIESATFKIWPAGAKGFESIVQKSATRTNANPRFNEIDAYAIWLKDSRDQSRLPLDYQAFVAHQRELKDRAEKHRKAGETDQLLTVLPSPADQAKLDDEADKAKEFEQWKKALSKDIYLHEAFHVTGDLGRMQL
jgi:carboxyl-terminal processing protease